jgi:hypothetical protein
LLRAPRRHCRAERFLTPDRQHRHPQTGTCGKPRAVIGRVLVEGGELREAGMHGAGQRIELSVMDPCRLAEAGRIGRELVPEAIEVDALAPGQKSLHVGSAEAEMP